MIATRILHSIILESIMHSFDILDAFQSNYVKINNITIEEAIISHQLKTCLH
ncbi:hypothetical protein LguiA_029126 [Lonicera macranthoides]